MEINDATHVSAACMGCDWSACGSSYTHSVDRVDELVREHVERREHEVEVVVTTLRMFLPDSA